MNHRHTIFDPTNPSVIYAGTGENLPNNSSSLLANTPAYLGDGMYKSTDEGATWNNIGLTTVGAIPAIGVHHQNPQIIYAVGGKQAFAVLSQLRNIDSRRLYQKIAWIAPDQMDIIRAETLRANLGGL
jgi:hypothetical protein